MTGTFLFVTSDGKVSRKEISLIEFNDDVHELLNCRYYELVHLPGNFYMVVDELGKCYEEPLPVNMLASMLYPGTPHGDPIVGHVLIGKLGYVNGESDMVGLSESELNYFEEYFKIVENVLKYAPEDKA